MKYLFDGLHGCPLTERTEKFVALICDRRALPYPSNLPSFLTVIHEALKDIKVHGYGHDQWDDHLSAEEVVDLLLEMKGLCNYLAKNGPSVVRPSAVSLIGLILHHSTAALATSGS